MIFGILSIWVTFIPGIIFACIARKGANEVMDINPYSEAAKFAKVAKITGTIGLVFSIIYTVLYPFIVMFMYSYYLDMFMYYL